MKYGHCEPEFFHQCLCYFGENQQILTTGKQLITTVVSTSVKGTSTGQHDASVPIHCLSQSEVNFRAFVGMPYLRQFCSFCLFVWLVFIGLFVCFYWFVCLFLLLCSWFVYQFVCFYCFVNWFVYWFVCLQVGRTRSSRHCRDDHGVLSGDGNYHRRQLLSSGSQHGHPVTMETQTEGRNGAESPTIHCPVSRTAGASHNDQRRHQPCLSVRLSVYMYIFREAHYTKIPQLGSCEYPLWSIRSPLTDNRSLGFCVGYFFF